MTDQPSIPAVADPADAGSVVRRAADLFEQHRTAVYRRTSRMFAVLMVGQWLFAIAIALVYSPYAWEGKEKAVHFHVYAAVFLGGLISSLPIYLALTRPSAPVTRYVISVAQVMWSALLIHLTGGRIETHFHVFGSLAFLSFYRDWKVLLPATVVVAADHMARQMFWPESVYGIVNPEWWRFLEHALWVVFEDTVLILACLVSVEEMRQVARARAEGEDLSAREQDKARALNRALLELRASQEQQVRTEKLAAVGQLAASVGHELRNPLAALRNAHAYIGKRMRSSPTPPDARSQEFLTLMDREFETCNRIINDLLDFARERPLALTPCPLAALVEDATALVPASKTTIVNNVSRDLPIPEVDRDQFRQVLVNLIQNAAEALDAHGSGTVEVSAEHTGAGWRLTVADDGPGIPPDKAERVFEPLFTTKSKGTGLGLAIVAGIVKRHNGTIRLDNRPGQGARFIVEWSPPAAAPAAEEVA